MLRLPKESVRSALFDNNTGIHENDLVSDLSGKTHFVRHHDHGHTVFSKGAHHIENLPNQFGIERARRLIE